MPARTTTTLIGWTVIIVSIVAGLAGGAWLIASRNGSSGEPSAADFAAALGGKSAEDDHEHAPGDGHDHTEGEGHDHAGHDEGNSLELSPQALKNIGYEPFTVAARDFERKISLPGMIVERPGKTQYRVSAPLGGVVTKVHVIEGETVAVGQPLFDVRLTHEELVSAQGEYLKTLEELDVVNREIERLEALTEGVIPGSRLRDQKYERQKLEALLRAQRQSLLLHGLSDAEVDEIVKTRLLLQSLTIKAPPHDEQCDCGDEQLLHVQSLPVERGQQVEAGATLCVLADHCKLYIEGTAFEEDATQIRDAASRGAAVSADLLVRDRREPMIEGLKILYLSDQVDRESRAFHFYLTLPNEIALDRTEGEHRFMQWKFKPGQRVELRVPVEKWESRLVVPAEAIVSDGSEAYVFQQNGSHFDRVAVHVEYRDQQSAVIAADGALKPKAVIAARGAFQMNLDLKNKAGGGVDAHAGHTH
ncbi:efflux RND transporter periplasmic adaptor subunit [Lacipirellula sp.]|uniref:efflux RND transporter periplasmic adaptor subunit n=1 Tax=Lacipirellula sp. TaxID=2691419 RepID=UPI003D0D0B5F